MRKYDWQGLINNFVQKFLADKELLYSFSYFIKNNKINFAPATHAEILYLEEKIDLELPPSYKQFLETTNGLGIVNQLFGNLFPANKVQKLSDFDQGFIDIWAEYPNEISDEEYFVYDESQRSEYIRNEYLKKCIVISDWFDGGIILLNPCVKFGEEWEAWEFATWYPGAARYKSFWELMQNGFKTYLELSKKD